jgi:hypothetical protein
MYRLWKRPLCWVLGHKAERFVWCRRCGLALWKCRHVRLTEAEKKRQATLPDER